MRKQHGFTLIELLIALIITGFVMGSVLVLLFSIFKNYEYDQDITEAKQRGQIAIAAMQPFVINAGLGLPPSATDFQKAFRWSKNRTISALPVLFPVSTGDTKNFGYFIQLATNSVSTTDAKSAPALWTVYSVPSGARVAGGGTESMLGVMADTDNDSDSGEYDREISISGSLSPVQIAASFPPNTLKSWVAFPAATPPFPFTVAELTASGSIKIRSHSATGGGTIPSFDELHYVRAAKIFVADGELKIDRLDGSGAQSVVDGIAGMWCTFDPDGDRVLTVRILARAGTMREGNIQVGVEGWPAEAEAVWTRDNHYRHVVVSRSWRIRN